MEDFFFMESSRHDTSVDQEDDDPSYDALNSETFGDIDSCTDWEENHENYATNNEFTKITENTSTNHENKFDEENSELGKRIASFILDDENDDAVPLPQATQPQLDHWFQPGTSQRLIDTALRSGDSPNSAPWWNPIKPKTTTDPYHLGVGDNKLVSAPKIMLVEDIEKQMRKEVSNNNFGNSMVPNPVDLDMRTRNSQQLGAERGVLRPLGPQPFGGGPLGPHRMPTKILGPRPPPPGPMNHQGLPMYPSPHYPHRMRGPALHPRPPHLLHGQNHMPPRGHFPQHMPHMHLQQGAEAAGPSSRDEYAGLMTNRDKMWLNHIQMSQLSTENSYQYDYYCTMLQHRQQGNAARKMNNQAMSNSREVPVNKTTNYSPVQFENSLGKLQIGSVMAPRKIIDMDLVDIVDNNVKVNEQNTKQLLMEAEELCTDILLIEEWYNPNLPPQFRVIKNIQELRALQDKIVVYLCSSTNIVSVMSIRKGKRAVLKLLPLMTDTTQIIEKLLTYLMPITKKDSKDEFLLSFLPPIRTFLSKETLQGLIKFMNLYESSFYLSTKFTVSVTANMLERAEVIINECKDKKLVEEWKLVLERVVKSTEFWKEGERPVVSLNPSALSHHLDLIGDKANPKHIETLMQVLSKKPMAKDLKM